MMTGTVEVNAAVATVTLSAPFVAMPNESAPIQYRPVFKSPVNVTDGVPTAPTAATMAPTVVTAGAT